MAAQSSDAAQSSHSYFIPMVDMLAGVVFILIILLAAVSLLAREEFSQAQEMQEEIQAIQAELQQAREMERAYLDPRRDARAALRLLLQRLQRALAEAGIQAVTEPNEGVLLISAEAIYFSDSVALTQTGERAATALAAALTDNLPCLSPGSALAGVECADYPAARLELVTLAVRSGSAPGDAITEGRSLNLLAGLARLEPELTALTAPQGDNLIVYRGLAERIPPAIDASATDEADVGGESGLLENISENARPGAGEEADEAPPAERVEDTAAGGAPAPPLVEFHFIMNVPPLPAELL